MNDGNRNAGGRLARPGLVLGMSAALAVGIASLPRTATAAEPGRARIADGRARGPLNRYVARPDESYGWFRKTEGKLGSVDYAELILTSQTWRGIDWKHQLFVIRPSSAPADADHALLVIAGGRWKDKLADPDHKTDLPDEAPLFAAMAERMKTPVAVLLQVPQQPLFDGKVEDEIIALTFEKFLKTGDEEWPLLLPMVKSAVRGMDAVQKFAHRRWSMKLESFTVTGASKRGWTTWLTGAVDPRATALAPMVIDVLNMQRHLKHQEEVWGGFSRRIHDYTDRGIQHHLASPGGEALRAIVDPYSYRRLLRQPKLIVIGTNDRYWPLDALNLYWKDLVGPKYILYVPNNRHGLRDFGRVLGTLSAVHRHASGDDFRLPKLSWAYRPNGTSVELAVTSDIEPRRVDVWAATAENRDFRRSEWTARSARHEDDRFVYELPRPESGFAALFAEAVFRSETLPFYLSTNVRIVGPSKKR